MKIKLAILEKDSEYLNHIVSFFNTKYSDKLETYSFTDYEKAITNLSNVRIDVFIASDEFSVNVDKLPRYCGFAYLVDTPDIENVNDQRVICKYQKVDLIYKQILSIYAEKAGSISGLKLDGENTRIVAFNSVSGGTGASTVAASYSVYLASKGKKVLYLNLEKFGTSDAFFSGEGQFNMSDIIFALKSKKTNMSLKLESCVRQDISGVHFYSHSPLALDMLELNCEEMVRLVSELKLMGSYDYLVIDSDFSLDKQTRNFLSMAHFIIWVGDGSEISNEKITRAYEALAILENNADAPIINRIMLIYNKFSNKTGKSIGDIGLKSIGGAPRYEHATTAQVIEQLSKKEMFDKII